jgi:hypothetical protein
MSNYSPINHQLSYSNSNFNNQNLYEYSNANIKPVRSSSIIRPNEIYNNKNLNNMYQDNIPDLSFTSTQEYKNQYAKSDATNIASITLRGFIEENEISRLFFSAENIDRVQKKIKLEVYERSKGNFNLEEDQEPNDLIVTMRYIYLDNCKNLPHSTVRQVKILNNLVIDYVLPDIMTNIKQYYGYIKDISTPLQTPMRPIGTSSAGRRLLPSYTTLWK